MVNLFSLLHKIDNDINRDNSTLNYWEEPSKIEWNNSAIGIDNKPYSEYDVYYELKAADINRLRRFS